jgi:hypothetical protein
MRRFHKLRTHGRTDSSHAAIRIIYPYYSPLAIVAVELMSPHGISSSRIMERYGLQHTHTQFSTSRYAYRQTVDSYRQTRRICQCVVRFETEVKTEDESLGKHVFRKEPPHISE